MLLAALALAAMPVDAAERAFAAAAQRDGQWTAFRAFAADDAITFAPELVKAQVVFKDLKNPPNAVMWWPARTITACDGSLAISTGPWVLKGGTSQGTFTTVWQRQAGGGWKWLVDQGRSTPSHVSAGEHVAATRAACTRVESTPPSSDTKGTVLLSTILHDAADDVIVQFDDQMPAGKQAADVPIVAGKPLAHGASVDRTLAWSVQALVGSEKGSHILIVRRWNGKGWPIALIDVTGVKTP